jgi:carboxyl-terminal processing protease
VIKFFKNVFIWVSAGFFLLTLTGLALSAMERGKKSATIKEMGLLDDAMAFIRAQYVDETEPKDLVYGALDGMIGSLDPHSQFLTPEEYEDLKADTEGKFGGIGVEITVKDHMITVITPIDGTPAWEAGLKTNDRIVKIEDTVIKNFTLNEAVKKLRGKPQTEVNIVVWREKEGKLYPFKIKRALINVKAVKEAKILESGIAYLRLVEFREDTPQELDRVLKDLKEKGADSLILDLRNNPGGLLEKAIEVAQRFLPKGAVVVSTHGRDHTQNVVYKSDLKSSDVDLPLVLLVNEGSASGSEIVAGAFQDHGRAIILGEKTFGKGSVQTVLPLKDGSALKLTTSLYFTPKGGSIHEKGIIPDIVVAQLGDGDKPRVVSEETGEDLEKIFENIEAKKPVDGSGALSEPAAQDAQLSRAVDLLKSIKIYKNLRP